MKSPTGLAWLLALRALSYYLAIGVAIGAIIGLLIAWVRQLA